MPAPESDLTRETLYNAIWQTPACHLAKSYGISNYTLTKLCDRFNIPRPGNDYWLMIRRGFSVEKQPLPPATPEMPSSITMPQKAGPRRPIFRQSEETAASPPSSPEVNPFGESPKRPRPFVHVAGDFRSAHRLIRSTWEHYAKCADTDKQGRLRPGRDGSCVDVAVTKPQVRRALLIMDAVIRAFAKEGCDIRITDSNCYQRNPETTIRVGKEDVPIAIKEKTVRRERQLTEADKERPSYFRERYEFHGTGVLSFSIGLWRFGSSKNTWTETKKHRLEDMLDEIVAGVKAEGEAMRQRTLERLEEERCRAEEQRLRMQIERRRAEEEERQKTLERQAERWHQCERLREFLRACEHALADRTDMSVDSPARRWLDWALMHADRIDPLHNGYVEQAPATLPVDSMRVIRDKAPPMTPPPSPA